MFVFLRLINTRVRYLCVEGENTVPVRLTHLNSGFVSNVRVRVVRVGEFVAVADHEEGGEHEHQDDEDP